MKILMVLTSHDELGDTGEKTGFWLEELAAPYYAFKDAGADIVLASPNGSYCQIWCMTIKRRLCQVDHPPVLHPETERCSRPASVG